MIQRNPNIWIVAEEDPNNEGVWNVVLNAHVYNSNYAAEIYTATGG